MADPVPVIVGVGQITDRRDNPTDAPDPRTLIIGALQRAAADAGIGATGLSELDSIDVVNVVSWLYDDLAARVAGGIEAHPVRARHSEWGGNQPTLLLDRAAERIAAGHSRLAAVCGGEAFRSLEVGLKSGTMPDWPPPPPDAKPIDVRDEVSPAAWAHGLRLPPDVYPLFENALRHARRESLTESQHWSAQLWAATSRVAAANPDAWQREPRDATEIETVSPTNRMVAFPYPKLMNALLSVNQAAAVILADTETARALGVPEDLWIYPWGGAGASDPVEFLARVAYHRSPAMEAALDGVLASTGLEAPEIDAWELYSCFPCVPKMAIGHLGLPADTPISVTGGLTFFGGPGNAYMLHAITSMTQHLRDHGGTGLLYGQGGFLTKHHALVVARTPPPGGYPTGSEERDARHQARVDREPVPPFVDAPSGRGVVETYTVVFDRAGAPERGIVVGLLESGARFVANTSGEDILRLVEGGADPIGHAGTVATGEGTNAFRF